TTLSGVELAEDEFVADTFDFLAFEAYIRRKGADPEEVVQVGSIEKVELVGSVASLYDVQLEEQGNERYRAKGCVFSKEPLLYLDTNLGWLKLRVEGKVPGPDGNPKDLEPLEKPLTPRILFLKLWVVPGARPGTSEAGAFVCLAPGGSHPS